MKSPDFEESPTQKRARQRTEAERIQTVQEAAVDRTNFFQRLTNPRMSLFKGFRGSPVARSNISLSSRPMGERIKPKPVPHD